MSDMNMCALSGIPDERLRNIMRERIIHSTEFATLRQQIAYLAEKVEGQSPPLELIAAIFSLNRGTIYNHLQRFRKEQEEGPMPRGRPQKLPPEIILELEKKIVEDYASHMPSTYASLTDWLHRVYGLEITPDVLGAIIRRQQTLKTVKARPMEDRRVLCDQDAIDDYLDELKRMVNDRPACLVCNLDEMGYLEYQDTPVQTVVVPEFHKGGDMPLMVNRCKRRMSILTCIFADQTTAVPLVVLSRKTIEKELYDFGFTPEKVMFAYQENGFVTTDIFLEWAMTYLIPEYKRRMTVFHDKGIRGPQTRGIIIMDGLKQHFSEYFEDECFIHGIDILELPSHSSDQTQPLDLCVFASCKRVMPRCVSDGFTTQTRDVDRLLSAIHSACTPHNIRKSFQRAGISVQWRGDRGNGVLLCTVDLQHCDRIRHLEPTPPDRQPNNGSMNLTERFPLAPGDLPSHFRETISDEILTLQVPLDAPQDWTLDPNFESLTACVLKEIFPEGTDHLVTQENRQKVANWRQQQRQKQENAPFIIPIP